MRADPRRNRASPHAVAPSRSGSFGRVTGAKTRLRTRQARIDAGEQAEIQARLARATLGRFWIGASDVSLDTADFEDTGAARKMAGPASRIDLAVLAAQCDFARAKVRVRPSPSRRRGCRPPLPLSGRWVVDIPVHRPISRTPGRWGRLDRARKAPKGGSADPMAADIGRIGVRDYENTGPEI